MLMLSRWQTNDKISRSYHLILSADFFGEIWNKFYCWIYRRSNRYILYDYKADLHDIENRSMVM